LAQKGGGGSKPKASGNIGLTESQKQRAVEMFGADSPDDKCYELFKDAFKDEIKKNPKFDPYKD
jgi:hypothetical protein